MMGLTGHAGVPQNTAGTKVPGSLVLVPGVTGPCARRQHSSVFFASTGWARPRSEFGVNLIVVTVVLRRRLLHGRTAVTKTSFAMTPGRARRGGGTWTWGVAGRGGGQSAPAFVPGTHGVVVEAVLFARPGEPDPRLDDLIAGWRPRMDKTSITRLVRVSWRTMGRVVSGGCRGSNRDVSTGCSASGRRDLVAQHHRYFDAGRRPRPRGRRICEGQRREDARRFFDELGPVRSASRRVSGRSGAFKAGHRRGHGPRRPVRRSVPTQ